MGTNRMARPAAIVPNISARDRGVGRGDISPRLTWGRFLVPALLALKSLLADLCYDLAMATITIRNLDDKVKRALQVRAALNGRSMEAEARASLSEAVERGVSVEPEEDLGTAIHKRFAAFGGMDLQIPPRRFSSRSESEPDEKSSKPTTPEEGLGTAIHKLFAPLGGVDLQIPTRRKSHRQTPNFE